MSLTKRMQEWPLEIKEGRVMCNDSTCKSPARFFLLNTAYPATFSTFKMSLLNHIKRYH